MIHILKVKRLKSAALREIISQFNADNAAQAQLAARALPLDPPHFLAARQSDQIEVSLCWSMVNFTHLPPDLHLAARQQLRVRPSH
jgi:hypothetical protein